MTDRGFINSVGFIMLGTTGFALNIVAYMMGRIDFEIMGVNAICFGVTVFIATGFLRRTQTNQDRLARYWAKRNQLKETIK